MCTTSILADDPGAVIANHRVDLATSGERIVPATAYAWANHTEVGPIQDDLDPAPQVDLAAPPYQLASTSSDAQPKSSMTAMTPVPSTNTPSPQTSAPAPKPASTSMKLVAQSSPPISSSPPAPPLQDDSIIDSMDAQQNKIEYITVGRNSSMVINTKVKVDAVEIADPSVADVTLTSPTRIIIAGRSYGTTQMLIRVGNEQRVFNVSCELDLSMLQGIIRSIAPQADVQPRSVNGTIVLTGTVPDNTTATRVAEVASLVQGGEVRNQLVVAGNQQTVLRVVVAEVSKEAMRQLGINWAIGGSDWTRDFFFANNLGQLNPTNFFSNGVANLVASNSMGGQNIYSVGPVNTTGNVNVTFGFPRAELQIFLNALRENNLTRILAEPNLVVLSGQTGTFLAGGEVPIPVTQGGAVAGAIVIEYKEFGVRLAFTPTVMAGQIIRIHVLSEFSDAVPQSAIIGGLPVFSFITRRVESTVECGNGQTFAIAGLLSEQVQALASKIPGMGDIPILGTLFSSTQYEKRHTELLILISPQLVEPMDPHQVAPPPGSLMTDPNDYELFALQQLEGTPLPKPIMDGEPRDRYPVSIEAPKPIADWPDNQNMDAPVQPESDEEPVVSSEQPMSLPRSSPPAQAPQPTATMELLEEGSTSPIPAAPSRSAVPARPMQMSQGIETPSNNRFVEYEPVAPRRQPQRAAANNPFALIGPWGADDGNGY